MTNSEKSQSSYKSILKAISLFASVKLVTIIVNILKNKVIAVLLGTAGVGLLGIFSTTLNLINSISDLGISKSSVRNISKANATKEADKTSKVVFIFRRLLVILSLTSAILTIVFSKTLSYYSFGNYNYTSSFIWLSIAVFSTSISNGQLSIVQGMRQLKALAKASTLGAIWGLITSIPLIYLFGQEGIVPSLIVSSLTALLLSSIYLKKIKFTPITFGKEEMNNVGRDMVKLGIAMMLVSFMVAFSGFILRAYINNKSGIEAVGLFQAGFTIVSGYFGMIFAAMSTDYFPRLSAVSDDNLKIETEVNQQSIIALILLGPLVVVLLFVMPLFIEILYSAQFLGAARYVNWAIYGVIFQTGVYTLEMILIAKNRSKIFVTYVFVMQFIFLINYIVFYNQFGLEGLGIAFSISMLINLITIIVLIKKLYNINLSRKFYEIFLCSIGFAFLSFLLKDLGSSWIKNICAFLLTMISIYYSTYMLKKILGIKSIWSAFKSKVKN